LIGGSYSEARDKYVTPAGYLDGVDILGRAVLSAKKAISVAPPEMFVLLDVLLGVALLTATWYLQRAWSLFLAFVLLPTLAVGASFAIFHVVGLFASFVPVVVGVLIHRMLEHFYEHWDLQREVRRLRARAL
jgi:CHASE2 domain-containing sensor protein